jgi:hypothetical protein
MDDCHFGYPKKKKKKNPKKKSLKKILVHKPVASENEIASKMA